MHRSDHQVIYICLCRAGMVEKHNIRLFIFELCNTSVSDKNSFVTKARFPKFSVKPVNLNIAWSCSQH